MGDLLTTGEYKAIAAGLDLPTQAFIDGGFRPAKSGKTFDSVNPATGAVLARSRPAAPRTWISPWKRRATPSRTAAGRGCIPPSARRC
jgi:hypothetical protein